MSDWPHHLNGEPWAECEGCGRPYEENMDLCPECGAAEEDDDICECSECGAKVPELHGCPDGAEVCDDCLDGH
jgi:predicted amidophosphoribosyltransferase